MRGVGLLLPTQGEWGVGASFFLDGSFEHQFNSSSRTLSEAVDKWVLLMWGVITLRGAIITDKTTELKICIPMWPAVA